MATTTRKPRQQHLPGTEPPKVPKIERLAEKFTEARDEWMAKHQPMTNAQDLLHAAMKEAGLKEYEMPDGSKVEIVGTEKVRVRKAKSDNGEE